MIVMHLIPLMLAVSQSGGGVEAPIFIQFLATMGVGGVLAGMMFHYYRRDITRMTDQWRGQSELLFALVTKNTEANTKLVGVVEALHRRLDDEHFRKSGFHGGERE